MVDGRAGVFGFLPVGERGRFQRLDQRGQEAIDEFLFDMDGGDDRMSRADRALRQLLNDLEDLAKMGGDDAARQAIRIVEDLKPVIDGVQELGGDMRRLRDTRGLRSGLRDVILAAAKEHDT